MYGTDTAPELVLHYWFQCHRFAERRYTFHYCSRFPMSKFQGMLGRGSLRPLGTPKAYGKDVSFDRGKVLFQAVRRLEWGSQDHLSFNKVLRKMSLLTGEVTW